jgi:hypothetical protein
MVSKVWLQIRLRSLLIAVALASVALLWITPWLRGPRIPSKEETQAILIATKELTKLGYGKPDQIQARRLDGGEWDVKCSFIYAPQPGGLRTDIIFQVDAQKSLGYKIISGGAY